MHFIKNFDSDTLAYSWSNLIQFEKGNQSQEQSRPFMWLTKYKMAKKKKKQELLFPVPMLRICSFSITVCFNTAS